MKKLIPPVVTAYFTRQFYLTGFIIGLMLCAIPTAVRSQTVQVFSSSGIFTVPACVTSITVQCWGAGGGGGGGSEASGGTAGAGGGGGGFATAVLNNVSGTFTVTVGGGGNGGVGTSSTGGTSTAGGNSSVTNGTITVTAVGGGAGGCQSAAGVSTAVGIGGGGTFVGVSGSTYKGGNGAEGNNADNNTGGAGGGGAGNAGDGVTPSATQRDANGTGGAGGPGSPNTAQYKGGAGGSVSAAYYENGGPGSTIGGGGAGGGGETSGGVFGHGTSPGTGGSGGDGQVIISYTTSLPTITTVTGSGCPGSTITINGTLLSGATSVVVGSTAVTNLSISSTVITGTIAPGTSTGTVKVVNSCGTATSNSPFTVYPVIAPVNLGTQSICGGASYSFGGHTYNTPGTYRDTTTSIHGCDSITYVTLVGGAVIQQSISQSLCGGGSYSFGGHTYSSSGTYMDTATSTVTGCDSITTLTLSITPALYHLTTQTICAGAGGYTFDGNTYTANGTYADTLTGAGTGGCDSISALTLTVNPVAAATINDSICNGASYNFNGHTYSSAGTYADTLTGASIYGCDSIVTLHLAIKTGSGSPVTASTTQPEFCPGDSTQICATSGFASYQWSSGDTTACFYTPDANSYIVTATDINGCTSVSNNLVVSNYTPTPVTISVNGDTLTSFGAVSYQWYLGGQAIPGDTTSTIVAHQSGSYTVEVTDVHGCHYSSSATTVTTAINNLQNGRAIKVYPNPLTGGNWQLQVNDKLIGSKLELFDANGQLIFQSTISNQQSAINITDAATGVYELRITSAQVSYNLKLIKLY